MTEQERLVALISEFHEKWKHGDGDWRKGLADYLLSNGYCQQSDGATDINVGNKSEWISVEERLPERAGMYLCCTNKGNVTVCNYHDHYSKGNRWDRWDITHWMPFPSHRR